MKQVYKTVVTAFTCMASAIDCQVTNSFEGVIKYQVEMTNTPRGCLSQNVVHESRIPSRMSFACLFIEQVKAVNQHSELLKKLDESNKVQLKCADVGV
jgi:hypothetical protein